MLVKLDGQRERERERDVSYERFYLALPFIVEIYEVINGMIALHRLLHPVAGVTQKLQGHTIDVIDAYQNINACIEDIQLLRENVDQESDVIFRQVV